MAIVARPFVVAVNFYGFPLALRLMQSVHTRKCIRNWIQCELRTHSAYLHQRNRVLFFVVPSGFFWLHTCVYIINVLKVTRSLSSMRFLRFHSRKLHLLRCDAMDFALQNMSRRRRGRRPLPPTTLNQRKKPFFFCFY